MITTAALPKRNYKSEPDKIFAFVYTALIADSENTGNEHTEFPCPCCHGRAWIDKKMGQLEHFHAECSYCGMKVIE